MYSGVIMASFSSSFPKFRLLKHNCCLGIVKGKRAGTECEMTNMHLLGWRALVRQQPSCACPSFPRMKELMCLQRGLVHLYVVVKLYGNIPLQAS